MTAIIMPRDFGMEMMVGSSPVLTSHPSMPWASSSTINFSPMWHGFTNPGLSCSESHAVASQAVTTITSKLNPAEGYPSAICGFNPGATQNSRVPSSLNRPTPPGDSFFNRTVTCRRSASVNNGVGMGSSRRSETLNDRRHRRSGVTERPAEFNLRSILASKNEETDSQGCTPLSPSKEKKKVSFADVLGQNLTRVKIITERPDCPPRWSPDFLEQLTGGAKPEALPASWEIPFAQPVSDYIKWKERLERDSVALENIIFKSKENILTGTVKVRNISFHKEVIIRSTTNNWASSTDTYATYVPSTGGHCSYNIYDTFSFELPLPSSEDIVDKVEFCICYTTDDHQFWDNNTDKNYSILSYRSKRKKNKNKNYQKPFDVYDVNLDSWSEFSAWTHLITDDSPYY